ncbi:hypothetical protein FNV43_RR20360 [Rhamnella rubrinervis]|uniref:Uncharacterized protein n=1 Tax=Rhamnella rubrinervis TaxID=2594499 RepID=A0A8K0GTB1_9ROSA|nr:hypothetical protein FNV43_RR20360 [Rhamnella rubrinervis]
MADIFVPILVENLFKLLAYEENLLGGVKDGVISLQNDLEFMNAFLKKSSGKRNDEIVKVLTDQIRDVTLDSEDVIDTYIGRVIKQRRRNLLWKLFHSIDHASVLHGVANQTSTIKRRIQDIYENKARYDIGEADQPSVDDEDAEQSLQRRRRNVEEDDVVGFEKHITTLINQLTNQSYLRREVISIHGMGGLGKTTLARKIYKDTRVKHHFDFCAWVSVSQQWQPKSLLLDVLRNFKQISQETSEKAVEDLKAELHEHLKGKKYLILMDDIWSTQVWEELRVAFPDDSNGSRILITTREREVAWHASPAPPYELQFLDENESWELLQKKVFQGGQCLPNLEEPGRELAKRCRGLPLSIVLLGGILASKEKSHRVWSRFLGNVNSYLAEGVSILKLSYNHLPRELKPCFLYVGMFPEDSEIIVKHLIELWIAEGFIQSTRNRSIYDAAEDYLEKLIDRSMIQVATKRLDGGVKTCRIHDLVRDLCISESRRDKLFDIYSIDNNVSLNRKSRRLSIQSQSVEPPNFDLSPCARSLFFFGVFLNPISKSVSEQIFKSMKFIRVLYLFELKISKIPSQIEELIFLRCLVINCFIHNVSSSIWNFRYLETLHLEFRGLWSLPKGIWSLMKNLRYLYLDYWMGFDLCNIPRKSLMGEPFWNLQVLSWLRVNKNTALVIARFPNLRKLGLCFDREFMEEDEEEKIMASIRRLESLQSIKISKCSTYRMEVGKRLNSLPSTLTKISLDYDHTRFEWDTFKVLARQPHLRVLKIKITNARPQTHEIRVVAGEFPQLQALKLRNLRIKTWEMEKDAMPNLHSLFISDEAVMLEYLPEELLCRSTLQLVEVIGKEVPDKLKTMLTDFKIKHPATPCKINITEGEFPMF